MTWLSDITTVEDMMIALPDDHPAKKSVESTYYSTVPKRFIDNLYFRKNIIQATTTDLTFRRQIQAVCAKDYLFWVNTFVYTFDPRKTGKGQTPLLPFITYDFQDETMLDLNDAIEVGEDVLIEKSRDMGASWMCLLTFTWRWLYRDLQSFMMVSRNQDLVDKSDDADCLFWKVDFTLKHLPLWMLPSMRRTRNSLKNDDNGSSITGDSTTSDSGRGGRKTAILLDEFAAVPNSHEMLRATRDSTDCRFYNSTPKGSSGAFAELAKKASKQGSKIRKHRLHWTRHPEKARGKYILDYKPELGDRVRSPWYDLQCERALNPAEIAQELDIDYFGSDFQYFNPLVLDRVLSKTRPPHCRGELVYSTIDLEVDQFEMRDDGRWFIWESLTSSNNLPRDVYAIGADISTGSGATPSVLSVGNLMTRKKVAEFACPRMEPDQFADLTIATAHWLAFSGRPAFVIFEANGPGAGFAKQVERRGFRHVYWRQDEVSIGRTPTMKMGWYSVPATKRVLLDEYKAALRDDEFENPSHIAILECRQYVYGTGDTITHAASLDTIDPSGARQNHSDRVIADALLNKAMIERPDREPGDAQESDLPPVGSFAERNAEVAAKQHAEVAGGWSDRWFE